MKLTLATLALAASTLAASPASAASPREFLMDASRGDASEVMLGQMIAQRAMAPRVRQYGMMLMRDHSKGLREAQMMAARLHVRASGEPMPEAREEARRLRTLRGRAFDAEVKRYMIEDHEKDIRKFESQTHETDSATSAFASRTLPVLQHHLEVARSL